MTDKPRDATPEEIANEEARRRFESDVVSLQENILPIDAARTDAQIRLMSARLRGPLSPVLRIGLFLAGGVLIAFGFTEMCLMLRFVVTLMESHKPVAGNGFVVLLYLPVYVFLCFVGVLLIRVAFRRGRSSSQ
jgi:hypothetical protein